MNPSAEEDTRQATRIAIASRSLIGPPTVPFMTSPFRFLLGAETQFEASAQFEVGCKRMPVDWKQWLVASD